MLKRTGYWWNKKRVWYYGEERARKRAAKPHGLTILFGFLSPLLAVVATIISVRSLQTNQQSMKLGQRAYLTVSNCKIVLTPNQPLLRGFAPSNIYSTMTSVVHNSGNTPASVVFIEGETNSLFDLT